MLKLEYESERLVLKILKPYNYKIVLDYYIRNASFLEEWDPKREKYFYTPQWQRELLRYDIEDYKAKTGVKFWIFKKNSNKVIGNVCFSNIIMGNFKSSFMSYKLDVNEVNKGYITEAIKKAIDIMFYEFGLHRIEVNIIPKNVKSLRIVEKLGFIEEGFSQKYLMINGKWEDHKHFAIYND